jgi:hypothetical protein
MQLSPQDLGWAGFPTHEGGSEEPPLDVKLGPADHNMRPANAQLSQFTTRQVELRHK